MRYDAVKVFTATKAKERESLGEEMTAWLRRQSGLIELVNTEVRQSSDHSYHCLTIVVFFASTMSGVNM